jgi:hypothetical protein
MDGLRQYLKRYGILAMNTLKMKKNVLIFNPKALLIRGHPEHILFLLIISMIAIDISRISSWDFNVLAHKNISS